LAVLHELHNVIFVCLLSGWLLSMEWGIVLPVGCVGWYNTKIVLPDCCNMGDKEGLLVTLFLWLILNSPTVTLKMKYYEFSNYGEELVSL
jgi:hypothetical protein